MKCDKLYLELKVRVINVNYEKGAELLKHCQTLLDYSRLVYTAKRAIAANMLAMDMDIPTIAKAAGLSEDEIKELA